MSNLTSKDLLIRLPLSDQFDSVPVYYIIFTFLVHAGTTLHSGHQVNPAQNVMMNMRSVLLLSPLGTSLIGLKQTVMNQKVTSVKLKV